MDEDFDAWWDENEANYCADSLHMSEYHMASVVWDAAIKSKKTPIELAIAAGEDASGLCTVKDAAAMLISLDTDQVEMFFMLDGEKVNIELKIIERSLP